MVWGLGFGGFQGLGFEFRDFAMGSSRDKSLGFGDSGLGIEGSK